MKDFIRDSLQIIVEKGNGQTVLSFQGISDDRRPSRFLYDYFDRIVKEALREPVGKLVLDFRKLRYMNSSTVSPIIQFFRDLSDHSIPTVVYYDKNSFWQTASFNALKTLSQILKDVHIEGKSNK